jgi:hypothetical protein
MHTLEYEAHNPIVPLLNTAERQRITVIDVTTTSARHNLAALLDNVDDGHLIEMTAEDCDVWYAFNDSDAGTVDQTTQSSAETACAVLFDGSTRTAHVVGNHTWLVLKGSTDGALRIFISSLGPGQSAKDL